MPAGVRGAALTDQAPKAIAPILGLDDSEREFIDRPQAGDLRVEVLVPEDAEKRPAGRWPSRTRPRMAGSIIAIGPFMSIAPLPHTNPPSSTPSNGRWIENDGSIT